jgi:tetratricopeptide (TPR) repeat protein
VLAAPYRSPLSWGARFTTAFCSDLLSLQRTQLIQEVARLPELEYLFRHALTQEAAYSTILLKQRRAYHRRVGEALEALFPDQHEEMAGALADHFFQARAFEKALHYFTQAGDDAFRLHAVAEAENHYGQALACAEKVEVESHQLVHLYTRRGRAFELNSQFEAALRNYQEMSALAAELQDEPLKLASLTAQCVVRATLTPLYDVPQARALAEQALALVRKLDDRATEAKVLWAMLLVEAWGEGDNHKALEYGLRSLEIARELGLKEQMGFTLTNLINAYWNLNQLDAAREANLEAQAIWQELGNLPMLADAYTVKQAIHQLAGEFDAVLSVAQEGLRLSQSIGNLWNQMFSHYYMTMIYIDRGEVSSAIESIANHTQLTEEAGFFKFGVLKTRLSLYLTIGALDEAEPPAAKLYQHRLDFIPILRPEVLSLIILAKIGRGSLDQAQRILEEAYQGLVLDESAIIYTGYLVLAEIQLLLALEDPERALEQASYLAERVRRVGFRQILPYTLWRWRL